MAVHPPSPFEVGAYLRGVLLVVWLWQDKGGAAAVRVCGAHTLPQPRQTTRTRAPGVPGWYSPMVGQMVPTSHAHRARLQLNCLLPLGSRWLCTYEYRVLELGECAVPLWTSIGRASSSGVGHV